MNKKTLIIGGTGLLAVGVFIAKPKILSKIGMWLFNIFITKVLNKVL